MMAETQDTAAGALGERSPQPGRARAASFRVLLWKEWRQQRWTLLGMSALALALFVLGGFAAKRWSFGLSGAAYLFTLLGVPLVLSARAFASEDEDGTAAFLRELPFRPLQVFWAKLLVVVLASWAATGLLLLFGWLWAGYPDDVMRIRRAGYWFAPVPVGIWLLAPMTAAHASLLASLGLRSLATALLSCACLCLCVGSARTSLLLLDVAAARRLVWVAAAVVASGLSILLAAWLSARRHPRRVAQFGRGAGGCTAVVALFLVPAMLSVLYVSVLAAPEAYVRWTWWRGRLGRVSVSVPAVSQPAAILLRCELYTGEGVSLAILDPATGRTAWLGTAPCRTVLAQQWGTKWSPEGSMVAWQGLELAMGAKCLNWRSDRNSRDKWRQGPGPEEQEPALFAYDVGRQRTTCVPDGMGYILFERRPSPWYDETTIAGAVQRPPRGLCISFANLKDGTVHSSPVFPGGEAALRMTRCAGTVVLPGRATWLAVVCKTAAGTGEELILARGAPDMQAAALLQVRDPELTRGFFRAVSPDGKWGLFSTSKRRDGGDCRLDLVDLASGATRRVGLPPEVAAALEDDELNWRSVLTAFFVADSERLLVSTQNLHAVYDLARDSWQVHAPPPPIDALAFGDGWRPAPDGEHLLQVCYHVTDGAYPQVARIFDVRTGRWTRLPLGKGSYGDVQWYGNEHVLAVDGQGVWRFGLDGSRELLWPRD